jgi:hypothetical protein
MERKLTTLAVLTGTLLAAGNVLADHNSKNGEGWANMPNDIHNTRIETREADDNEAFREFVKYGNGSTTENRFASDETVPAKAMNQQGKAEQVQNQAASKAQNRNKTATGTRSQDRSRSETRSRIHRDPSMSSQRSRSASATRSAGGRKGGGKR